jgi:hypothetical protein
LCKRPQTLFCSDAIASKMIYREKQQRHPHFHPVKRSNQCLSRDMLPKRMVRFDTRKFPRGCYARRFGLEGEGAEEEGVGQGVAALGKGVEDVDENGNIGMMQ